MRDILLGALTFFLAIAALIGTIVAGHYLFGPPLMDRSRSFAFNFVGPMMIFAIAMVCMFGALVYDSVTRVH